METCPLLKEHFHVGESNLVWIKLEGVVGTVRPDGTVFEVAVGVHNEASLEVLVLACTSRLYTMS